jgi:peptide/nickel transport system permease protein
MARFRNIFSNKTVDKLEEDILAGKEFSFRKFAWKQFRKNKIAFWAFRFLVLLVIIAILAPILANEKPLYCVYKGQTMFPAFSFKNNYEVIDEKTGEKTIIDIENFTWKQTCLESVVWPLISVYSPGKSDKYNYGEANGPFHEQFFTDCKGNYGPVPLRFRHWLGCTKDGSDVLSGLLHGIKFSLLIGIFSYLISSFLGILLGSLAGYFGNNSVTSTVGSTLVFCIGLVLAWFYGFIARAAALKDSFSQSGFSVVLQFTITIAVVVAILFVFHWLGKKIGKIKFLNKPIRIPVDSIISRSIEVLTSMPLFLLIVTIGVIARPSYATLIMILGFTSWTGIARLTRAEFLRIRALDYIQAGRSFGFSNARIIFRHALPNALAPSLVAIAFGIASCILAESSLSFLGVGVPPDVITWGKIISSARESVTSWWLVIFPGIAIFLTVLMYNLIGEGLRDALDPKLKS